MWPASLSLMQRILLRFLAVAALTSSAFGWDKAGHSLTAVVAYRDLEARHPEIIVKMTAILQQAEDYTQMLNWKGEIGQSSLPNNAKREGLMLFMLAARWPDDIKGDGSHRDKSPHDTHPWHYINLPYSLDGTPAPPAKSPNIVTEVAALEAEWGTAKDDAERAKILCFLSHFIGDSHQPLHSSMAYSKEFPKGDAGGGLWAIHSAAGASKLHSFWDDVVIKGDDASAIASKVDAEGTRIYHEHSRTSFPQMAQNKDIESWVQNETFPLAKRYAYLNGNLPRPKKGSPTTLTEGYKSDAKRVAESQMALAGYRLSDLLYQLLH